MKSFSQFLEESYLNEEEARQGSLFTRSGKPQNFKGGRTPFTATDPTPLPASKRLPAGSPEAPKVSSQKSSGITIEEFNDQMDISIAQLESVAVMAETLAMIQAVEEGRN